MLIYKTIKCVHITKRGTLTKQKECWRKTTNLATAYEWETKITVWEYSESIHWDSQSRKRWGTESKTGNKLLNKPFHWNKQWTIERDSPNITISRLNMLGKCLTGPLGRGTPTITRCLSGNERMRDKLWLEASYWLLPNDWVSLSIVHCLSQWNSLFGGLLYTSFDFNYSSLPPWADV